MADVDPSQRLAALAVLGLTEPVTRRAITEAYRRLARETHPDATGSSDPQASGRFAAIADAYRLLETVPPTDDPSSTQPAESHVSLRTAEAAEIPIRVHITAAETPPIVAGPVHVAPSRPPRSR